MFANKFNFLNIPSFNDTTVNAPSDEKNSAIHPKHGGHQKVERFLQNDESRLPHKKRKINKFGCFKLTTASNAAGNVSKPQQQDDNTNNKKKTTLSSGDVNRDHAATSEAAAAAAAGDRKCSIPSTTDTLSSASSSESDDSEMYDILCRLAATTQGETVEKDNKKDEDAARERESQRLEHERRCAARRIHSPGPMYLSRRLTWKLTSFRSDEPVPSPPRSCKLRFSENTQLIPIEYRRRQKSSFNKRHRVKTNHCTEDGRKRWNNHC